MAFQKKLGKFRFPVGLLSHVRQKLKKDVRFNIKPIRPVPAFPRALKTFSDGIALYPYQQHTIETFQENPNGILKLPVRAGKSLIGATLAVQSQVKTLHIVPTEDLLT